MAIKTEHSWVVNDSYLKGISRQAFREGFKAGVDAMTQAVLDGINDGTVMTDEDIQSVADQAKENK